MSLVISYFAIAWTEPTAPPPGDQVSAPINVGSVAQTKQGRLIAESFRASSGFDEDKLAADYPIGVTWQTGRGAAASAGSMCRYAIVNTIYESSCRIRQICYERDGSIYTRYLENHCRPEEPWGDWVAVEGDESYWTQSGSNLYPNNTAWNVGIGTTSPGARLDIGNAGSLFLSGHSTHSARVELGQGRTADGYAYIDFVGDTTYADYGLRLLRGNTGLNTWSDLVHRGTGELRMRAIEAAPLSLWTSNIRRIYITSGGNVGIGITNPGSYKLRVNGSVAATAFYYTSDVGLKKNIEPLSDSLEKILSLQGASFNWKDSDEPSIGLIAQEVEKIFPEAVSGSEGEKTIDYAKLIAPMIEAIKEQQKEIEALKAIIQ